MIDNGNPKITDTTLLEQGNYYRINGTKKMLYWDGDRFMKPQKDSRGKYEGWVQPIETQPKLKFAQLIKISELYG